MQKYFTCVASKLNLWLSNFVCLVHFLNEKKNNHLCLTVIKSLLRLKVSFVICELLKNIMDNFCSCVSCVVFFDRVCLICWPKVRNLVMFDTSSLQFILNFGEKKTLNEKGFTVWLVLFIAYCTFSWVHLLFFCFTFAVSHWHFIFSFCRKIFPVSNCLLNQLQHSFQIQVVKYLSSFTCFVAVGCSSDIVENLCEKHTQSKAMCIFEAGFVFPFHFPCESQSSWINKSSKWKTVINVSYKYICIYVLKCIKLTTDRDFIGIETKKTL